MKKIFEITCFIALFALVFTACSSGTSEAETSLGSVLKEEGKTVNEAPGGKAMTVANEGNQTNGYQIGDVANDFSLKGTDDQDHSLAQMSDVKGYVVTFTCNHCPYAVMYEDRLIDFHNRYAAKGYPVIAINPNDPAVEPEDSFEGMKTRAEEKEFPFLYLFDEKQEIYPQFGATKTPHVFLLDKDMVVRYIGAIDNNARDAAAVTEKYLENAIEAIEAGKDPEPNTTKAVGCSIKAKKS